MKRLRRPRMTRQLVERLIGYARREEAELGNLPECDQHWARMERQCLADIDWLWRMHDWFEANRELVSSTEQQQSP